MLSTNDKMSEFNVTIEKSSHGLGLEIVSTPQNGTLIEKLKVMPDGVANPAAACSPPLAPGDLIVGVNGVRTDNFKATIQTIRDAGNSVSLMIKRHGDSEGFAPVPPKVATDEGITEFTVSIEKSSHGLGLEIVSTPQNGTLIEKLKVMPDGVANPAAACNPKIIAGDMIIAVNGIKSNDFKTTVQNIRNCGNTVSLTLRRDRTTNSPRGGRPALLTRKSSMGAIARDASALMQGQMTRNNIGDLRASRFKVCVS